MWAEESRETVLNGTFTTDLLQAVDLVSDCGKGTRQFLRPVKQP